MHNAVDENVKWKWTPKWKERNGCVRHDDLVQKHFDTKNQA